MRESNFKDIIFEIPEGGGSESSLAFALNGFTVNVDFQARMLSTQVDVNDTERVAKTKKVGERLGFTFVGISEIDWD